MLRISPKVFPTAVLAALMISVLSSCAGQSDTITDLPESDAALLDDSEKATPVSDNPSVFADMAPAPLSDDLKNAEMVKAPEANANEPMNALTDNLADAAAPAATEVAQAPTANSDEPFYNPIGGEKLGRVAYALYGSKKKTKILIEKNPSLATNQSLTAGQPVYFSFDGVRPQPKLLTKDLIDRYPSELAQKLEGEMASAKKSNVTVGPGESLQTVSMRLYGTTRYWTELYLLNRDKISNYDNVKAGTELLAVERALASLPAAPVAEKVKAAPKADGKAATPAPVAEAPKPAPAAPQPAPEPVAQAPVAPAPVAAAPVAPVAAPAPVAEAPAAPQPVLDPIPETPATTSPVALNNNPADHGTVMKGVPAFVSAFFANSVNVRRGIYVVVILLIGAVAFVLTRPKKKNFDMLDVTTNDTTPPRKKFGGKNDQKLG